MENDKTEKTEFFYMKKKIHLKERNSHAQRTYTQNVLANERLLRFSGDTHTHASDKEIEINSWKESLFCL